MEALLKDLTARVKSYHPEVDEALITKAFEFGRHHHDGQLRKSGEPYFVHPVAVAKVIAEMRLDTASLCAALLHDTVEDTSVSLEDVRREFGEEIAYVVDGVTKLAKFEFTAKEDHQAENFRKMLVHMAKDIRVLLVKLADRLDNMRTLGHMKQESRERIARETLEIYAPLAHRLGISWLKDELEDLSFKHLETAAYEEIQRKVAEFVRDRERYIESTNQLVSSHLAEAGFHVEVFGRVKHLFSIWKKMRAKECDFEQVLDVIAFRVVVESSADCYAVLGALHQLFTPVPSRVKDYIALPKSNGYQSLHTTVIGAQRERMEIQIRTREMHNVAEQGVAAHWKYKERPKNVAGRPIDHRDAARFGWLRQLMEWQKDLKDPQEFLESVRVDLFQDEIYVFTPTGDVKVFPQGATMIDFAYAIHSDVGHHCAGARVNGVLTPLRAKLRSGDVVQIITDSKQEPRQDWIDNVVTSRAKARIRAYLRAENRAEAERLGREMLEDALDAAGFSLARSLRGGAIARVCTEKKMGTEADLFVQLGYGKLKPEDVVQALAPSRTVPPPELRPSAFERVVRRITGRDAGGITVSGERNVLMRFANCCSPLPGEPIVGYITRGKGVTVHRRDCNRGQDIDPELRINVAWDEGVEISRPVTLKVVTINRPGILADVSATFQRNGVNINEASCRAAEADRALNCFTFNTTSFGALRTVIHALQRVKGVHSVERVEKP